MLLIGGQRLHSFARRICCLILTNTMRRFRKKNLLLNTHIHDEKRVPVPEKSVLDECELHWTTSKHPYAGEGISSRFDLPLLHISCCFSSFMSSRNA